MTDTVPPAEIADLALLCVPEEAFAQHRWLRENAPVFFNTVTNSYFVSGYTECKFVLQHEELFRSPYDGELARRRSSGPFQTLQQFITTDILNTALARPAGTDLGDG